MIEPGINSANEGATQTLDEGVTVSLTLLDMLTDPRLICFKSRALIRHQMTLRFNCGPPVRI